MTGGGQSIRTDPQTHQSPQSLRFAGDCCLGTGPAVDSAWCFEGTGCRHTHRGSVASIPTYVPGSFLPSELRLQRLRTCCRTRGTLDGVLPCPLLEEQDFRTVSSLTTVSRLQVPAASLPTPPTTLSSRPPHLAARSPVHLPGESPAPFRACFLPGSRGLPVSIHQCAWLNAGHSRVRFFLCGRCHPLQAAFACLRRFPPRRSPLPAKLSL